MDSERKNVNGNHDFDYRREEYYYDEADREAIGKNNSRSNGGKLLPIASSPGASYIDHPVSKFDTLAGVAIKYGVEVADIKKMNGLVTDLQMFALKSLQIPLPGRHPPSPCLSTGSSSASTTPDLFDSFQSLRVKSCRRNVSPAMSSLQGYYGLKPAEKKNSSEGCELAVYRRGGSQYLEDEPIPGASSYFNTPLNHHRKSKSLVNGFFDEHGKSADVTRDAEAREADSDKSSEKMVRRRLKSVADFSRIPEMLMKEDNMASGGFSSTAGKGLALRSKAASRTGLASDAESSGLTPIPVGLGDSFLVDGFSSVRKSSSTSSLQDQEESSSSSSKWSGSKWSLKTDFQSLSSAAAITRPIFDGLPKPITGRRNKAALD